MHYIMLDLKTKRVYFLRCLSFENTDSIFPPLSLAQIDIMSCKLLSGVLLLPLLGFHVIVAAFLAPFLTERSASTAAAQLFAAVATGKRLLHSCARSGGSRASMCICLCCVRARFQTSTSAHVKRNTGALFCSVLTPGFPGVGAASWPETRGNTGPSPDTKLCAEKPDSCTQLH